MAHETKSGACCSAGAGGGAGAGSLAPGSIATIAHRVVVGTFNIFQFHKTSIDDLAGLIRRAKVDVVGLQEVQCGARVQCRRHANAGPHRATQVWRHAPHSSGGDDTGALDLLAKALGPGWGWRYCGHRKHFNFGNAVLSRFPFTDAHGTTLKVPGTSTRHSARVVAVLTTTPRANDQAGSTDSWFLRASLLLRM